MSLPVQILYAREELLLEPIWDVMQAPAYLNFKFFFFFGFIHESHCIFWYYS